MTDSDSRKEFEPSWIARRCNVGANLLPMR
jgi:hypothetical protein